MTPAIIQLRKELHRHPELSGEEVETAKRIERFIKEHFDTEIITGLGGNGLAAVFSFGGDGPVIMIRCELDALPMTESNLFEHRSLYAGAAHKCGHDGHMAIVAGLILWMKKQTILNGKVILLFQPSEENGRGAFAVLNDEKFKKLQPDFVFALHNLPREPLHTILIVKNVFSATVQSVIIHLQGRQSHASEPEKGINPAAAIAEVIQSFSLIENNNGDDKDFTLITPIHIQLGEKSYGISAGTGELHYTLRTWTEDVMNDVTKRITGLIETVCKKNNIQFSVEWLEYFPASVNDAYCNEVIKKAAEYNNYVVKEMPNPLRFGEDFGWFSQRYKTAMFGIGSGVNSPPLHSVDYDFPDEIIETGINMFTGILHQLLEEN
jgi:amidohydrolase